MLTLAHLQQRRSRRWLFGLTLLLLVTLLISLCAGDQWIPPGEWFSAKGHLFIWQIRLPRTLAVLLASSQADWFGPFPSSDMFGQMGLAQSTHLKYMLYNGWAIVVANIILFALLFQILV